MNKIPDVTVHGRFQPPLHINHWGYVREGFERAKHVTVLITNPFQDEAIPAFLACKPMHSYILSWPLPCWYKSNPTKSFYRASVSLSQFGSPYTTQSAT
jgi:hypothetical protein